ncbi:PLD nuclease N-terminal domain-containing protein [Georgenia halophila]|uniref:PLD nuclease N-terminal domain-containing protein n=1 Tax=Georgenia halophila TaxID=620889 RepID=A0ABP8KYX4_9MICO
MPVILIFAMVVYALIDCSRTPDDEMPAGLPKVLWIILIVLVPAVGALAWIIVSRVSRSKAQTTTDRRPGVWSAPTDRKPIRRSGPVAPDDDPEFLNRLERERRRAERERQARERRDDGTDPEASQGGTAAG